MRDLYEDRSLYEQERINAEGSCFWVIVFGAVIFIGSLFLAYYTENPEIFIVGVLLIIFAYVPVIIRMKRAKRKRDKWTEDRKRRAEQQKSEDISFENDYFHNVK